MQVLLGPSCHVEVVWMNPQVCLLGLEYPLYPSLVFPAGCTKSRLDETVSLLFSLEGILKSHQFLDFG